MRKRKWYEFSIKTLRARVLAIQKQRVKQEEHMFYALKFSQKPDALAEIKVLFKQYKHLKLWRSKIFRAWYKEYIDHALAHPDIYTLSLDGGPYDKHLDPHYHENAPDWERYRRSRFYSPNDDDYDYYDDDDYDYDDDYDDYDDDDDYLPRRRKSLGEAAAEGFALGVGFGIGTNLLGGGNSN